jgi:mannose-1-phosphate guanylyltransferase
MTAPNLRCIESDRNRADANARLYGLVLAGGDGQRVRPFVRRLRGDNLPKQYVNFTGFYSMLEHTYRRVEKLIPRERLLTVVNQDHLKYPEVKRQLRFRPKGTVIVQPANRETGPGLLLPLIYLHKRDPHAVVAIFPSDQFVVEADRLMRHIRLAHAVIEKRPGNLILLGINPDYQETDYGYIVPTGERDITGWGIAPVHAFVEKPSLHQVEELISKGALWNTMMMVFNVANFLDWVKELEPELYGHFAKIYDAIGTSAETKTIQAAYAALRAVNFSKEFLEPIAQRHSANLTVLPVTNVTWSDWGTECRILDTLKMLGKQPRGTQPIAAVRRSSPGAAKYRRPPRPAVFTIQQ